MLGSCLLLHIARVADTAQRVHYLILSFILVFGFCIFQQIDTCNWSVAKLNLFIHLTFVSNSFLITIEAFIQSFVKGKKYNITLRSILQAQTLLFMLKVVANNMTFALIYSSGLEHSSFDVINQVICGFRRCQFLLGDSRSILQLSKTYKATFVTSL